MKYSHRICKTPQLLLAILTTLLWLTQTTLAQKSICYSYAVANGDFSVADCQTGFDQHCSMSAALASCTSSPFVVMYLQTGVYNESISLSNLSVSIIASGPTVVFSRNINSNNASISVNQIHFQPESGIIPISGNAWSLSISNCSFIGCLRSCVSVANSNGTTHIENSTFQGNTGSSAVALEIANADSVMIKNCRFINNTAIVTQLSNYSCGAVYIQAQVLTVSSTVFQNNTLFATDGIVCGGSSLYPVIFNFYFYFYNFEMLFGMP